MTRTVRLRHLAEVNPTTPAFDDLDDTTDVTFMPLETIWADSRRDTTRARPKSEVAAGYVRFQAGDILSPKVTPTFEAGRTTFIEQLPLAAGAASTEVHVVRALPGHGEARFLQYVLRTKPFLDGGVSHFQGVAGLQRVPADFLLEFPVAPFEIDHQGRIADFLDDQVARIDMVIASRSAQHASVPAWPFTALADRIDRTGARSVPIRRVIDDIADGPFGSAFSSSDYTDSGPAVVRLGNIGFAEFKDSGLARIPSGIYERFPRCHVRRGDLLVAGLGDDRNHAGRACVAPDTVEPMLVKGKCFRAHVNGKVADATFLAALLSSDLGADAFALSARGATRTMLNLDLVLSTELPMPDLRTQLRLRDAFLSDRRGANELGNALEHTGALLDELKRSLITAAVSGEFDVSSADGSRVPV